ncbi:MAG TPA: PAS domain-containing protein [Hyphomicrobiaceae bacterium]|nr:PAS domain-containing protein [Hyphomicrobiaceae bacterium]
MKHKTTQVLYAYWDELRAGGVAPRRFEIEPGRIGDILPDTFILEPARNQGFCFRLAGTRICQRFGAELRGADFLEGWSRADRSLLEQHFSAITELGRVSVFLAEARSGASKAVSLEILVLPLVHTGNALDRLLGSISVLEDPDWLPEEGLTSMRLLAAEAIWPEGRPDAVVDQLKRQSPFLPHVRNARMVRQDRRQFRVYDGGFGKGGGDKL